MNNRRRGHDWEREIVLMLKKLGFPHIVTSRSESKSRDDAKVDIMNKDEVTNGRFPINIQAKNTAKQVDYVKILEQMPEGKNVIFNKLTEKKGKSFMTIGKYAILPLEDYLELFTNANRPKTQTNKKGAGDTKESSEGK